MNIDELTARVAVLERTLFETLAVLKEEGMWTPEMMGRVAYRVSGRAENRAEISVSDYALDGLMLSISDRTGWDAEMQNRLARHQAAQGR